MAAPFENITWIVPLLIILAAFLYSSVGHGGASGYLAVITLLGIAVQPFIPLILIVNILVASISFFSFYKAGEFRKELLLPFSISSIPAAYFGGMHRLSGEVFNVILGLALLLIALRLLIFNKVRKSHQSHLATTDKTTNTIWLIGLPIGAVLGLISGMIGIGGGVFLSPILLFLGLATIKESAAISAAFIVLNSLSGLLGHGQTISLPFSITILFIGSALVGGSLGSRWGALHARSIQIRYMLACVLAIASLKLFVAAIY